MNKTTKLVEELLDRKMVTPEQVEDARMKQVGAKKPIHEVLVEMDFIKEEDLLAVASKVFNLPIINLNNEVVDKSVLNLVSYEIAKRYGIFPLRKEENKLVVAMSNPQDIMALDDIRMITGLDIRPVLSMESDISKCIEEYYMVDDAIYDLMKNIVDDTKVALVKEGKSDKELFDVESLKGESSPVVRLVNLVLGDAVKAKASDIHIEPYEDNVTIRYRIDGFLKNIMKVPSKLSNSIAARIKILTDLDIAETRKPQDGRSKIMIGDHKIDLRVSLIPTFHGEKVVIRLLDTREAQAEIDNVGFQEEELRTVKEAIRKTQGMILVTGPTGSGKTTTIYAALNAIKSETINIITVEDPIEYLIEGINQIQVNPVKDVTFANGLRSILRQDPDVVLVGEVRDLETAEIAFRSSLTGHLVFSTLHTNSAISSITRLRDIGLESYLIGSSIILIVAQRLVRLICSNCKEEQEIDDKIKEKFSSFIEKHNIQKIYKGCGCDQCSYTGYSGRTAIFEILTIDEEIKELVSSKSSEGQMLQVARQSGFKTLAESGAQKISEGITTLEEMEHATDFPQEVKKNGLKKAEESKAAEKISNQINQEINKKFRILIVDDEEDIRFVLSTFFKSVGYGVLEACDGEEGIRMAHQERPDLIIMDVMMPVLDGISATKKLRSTLETASIPILMLTAKSTKDDELEGLDAGADDYVSKPFDREKLLARVRMLIQRRRRQCYDQ